MARDGSLSQVFRYRLKARDLSLPPLPGPFWDPRMGTGEKAIQA